MKRMPRILLVNKFYYPRGGDCICMINLEALLRRLGYEVAVYSMVYSQNLPSEMVGLFWHRKFHFPMDLKIKQERLAVSLD